MISHVLLVGAGVIAREHARAVTALSNGPAIALSAADPNPQALEKFCLEFPQAHCFPDMQSLLAQPPNSGDLVIIATPPFLHHPQTLASLDSGRNVLCEKPLALTADEGHEMINAAKQRGLFVGCCSSRFLGVVTTEKVKSLLGEGFFGKIHQVNWIHRASRNRMGHTTQPESKWFLDRSKTGGGTLCDWGVYDFTTLNDIFKPIKVEILQAWTARNYSAADPTDCVFDIEDQGGATLRYHLPDGISFIVNYERAPWHHGESRRFTEIEGSSGTASWDWLSWSGEGEVVIGYDRNGDATREIIPLSDTSGTTCHQRPIRHMMRAIEGKSTHPMANDVALFNFLVVRGLYKSAATGGKIIIEKPAAFHVHAPAAEIGTDCQDPGTA